jgi:hypothetical protein
VHVVSIARDGSPARAARIHGQDDGFQGAHWFGDALCALGDVDGDGVTDLLVGSKEGIWTLGLRADGAVRRFECTCFRVVTDEPETAVGASLACLALREARESAVLAAVGSRGKGAGSEDVIWWLSVGAEGRLAGR